jgi:hypothetical protein
MLDLSRRSCGPVVEADIMKTEKRQITQMTADRRVSSGKICVYLRDLRLEFSPDEISNVNERKES